MQEFIPPEFGKSGIISYGTENYDHSKAETLLFVRRESPGSEASCSGEYETIFCGIEMPGGGRRGSADSASESQRQVF